MWIYKCDIYAYFINKNYLCLFIHEIYILIISKLFFVNAYMLNFHSYAERQDGDASNHSVITRPTSKTDDGVIMPDMTLQHLLQIN